MQSHFLFPHSPSDNGLTFTRLRRGRSKYSVYLFRPVCLRATIPAATFTLRKVHDGRTSLMLAGVSTEPAGNIPNVSQYPLPTSFRKWQRQRAARRRIHLISAVLEGYQSRRSHLSAARRKFMSHYETSDRGLKELYTRNKT